MGTIGDILVRLLPHGSRGEAWSNVAGEHDLTEFPSWPPDAFGVAATLIRMTECYTHPAVRGGLGLGNHRRIAKRAGRIWAESPENPRLHRWLQLHWQRLISVRHLPVDRISATADIPDWAQSSLRLLAAADEACVGLGFGGTSWIALAGERAAFEKWQYGTWCRALTPNEACVQPKGRTPAVGCNLRSLSLHLSLLPPRQIVETKHLPRMPPCPEGRRPTELGVLLVPFPYLISEAGFVGEQMPGQSWGRLKAQCEWAANPSPSDLATFVAGLIDSVGQPVDVLVFPELALSRAQLDAVQKVAQNRRTRLVIAGIHEVGNPGRNLAVGTFAPEPGDDKAEPLTWMQSKHHRWRVDRWQIQNYGLRLDPSISWWEDIDITDRAVVAARFVEGSTIACLVCEDLARVEPVQPALREMGASLIVALLMDGPQYQHRWAAKSATVFADDPGSSVLAFTSLGLVRRSQHFRDRHQKTASPPIAVWQEPGAGAMEIPIQPDAHAVFFGIKVVEQEERTLDGRSDGGTAEVIRLTSQNISGFVSISHPAPPVWAAPMYRTQ